MCLGSVGIVFFGIFFFVILNLRISVRVVVGIVIMVYVEGFIFFGVGCCLFRMY